MLVEIAVLAGLVVLVLALIRIFLLAPYTIPSASMQPALQVGDRVLAWRSDVAGTPRIGEIVVFHPPADDESCADPRQGENASARIDAQACDAVGARESPQVFVKRIVGLGGDRLQIRGGVVIRDGRRESGSGVTPCPHNSACDFPGTIVVPRGDVYLMGDNRPASEDSRFWGPVPRGWLIGRVILRYWPLRRLGTP